jgi:hypothetical protein
MNQWPLCKGQPALQSLSTVRFESLSIFIKPKNDLVDLRKMQRFTGALYCSDY